MQLVLPVKEGKAPTELSSGQTGFSPDVKTFLAICENTPRAKQKAQSRTRPCAILQISVYKKQSNLMLWNKNEPMSRFRSVRFAPNYLGYIFL